MGHRRHLSKYYIPIYKHDASHSAIYLNVHQEADISATANTIHLPNAGLTLSL